MIETARELEEFARASSAAPFLEHGFAAAAAPASVAFRASYASVSRRLGPAAGESVEVPIYDFMTHTRRAETRHVDPAAVIIVEGILVFVEADVRDKLDIKLFVDTDADIRLMRRIRRDLEQRGRSFNSVREQYYATVRPMHLAYVEPSKRWADLIVPEGGDNTIALDVLLGRLGRVAYGRV